VTFDYLQQEAPFIAMELERRDLVAGIRQIMLYDVRA